VFNILHTIKDKTLYEISAIGHYMMLLTSSIKS